MTKKEAVKEICDYFNTSDYDKKKVKLIIDKIEQKDRIVKVKEIVCERVEIGDDERSFMSIEKITCKKYNVPVGHIKINLREYEYLIPRTYFVRLAIMQVGGYGIISALSRYLGVHHSSIVNAAYHSKIECGLPRIKMTSKLSLNNSRNKNKINEQH